MALNKLLWWGTLVAVPQMIPLAFIHSANQALWLAMSIGLMGGIATAAYSDLVMRSCPPGLQGTLMMLVDGVFALSSRGGDLLGSGIYNSSPRHGFLYCVIATTVVYTLILPLIALVPKALIATADGALTHSVGTGRLRKQPEPGRVHGPVCPEPSMKLTEGLRVPHPRAGPSVPPPAKSVGKSAQFPGKKKLTFRGAGG